MSSIAGLAFSKSSAALNQLQQRLSERMSSDQLQGISKHLEGQFPQMVNEAFPNWGSGTQSPDSQTQPLAPANLGLSTQNMPITPGYWAYYGYGRPLPVSNPLSSPYPSAAQVPLFRPIAPARPATERSLPYPPVGCAVPSGYTGRGQSQTGPAPYRWYS